MGIQLSKLIDRKVIVIGPSFFSQEKLETVTLLSVEAAGIWIQSDEAARAVTEKFRVAPSAPGLAFFIPFSEIKTILAGTDAASAD